MKTFLHFFKSKSLAWWSSVTTILALLVAIGAWLWPRNSSTSEITVTPQPTSLAQSLRMTDLITPWQPGITRILIAQFDDESQLEYKVTDLILANIRTALSTYPNIEVVATNRIITEMDGSKVALQIGQLYDASIVIWGWYGKTEKAVPLGVHFEIVESSETFHPNSCGVVTAKPSSQIRKIDPVKLSDLTLQTDISNELSYVTILTLGLAHYDAADWQNAIIMFDDALSHLTDEIILSAKTEGDGILIDQNLLYYYRGKAQAELGNYTLALEDFGKLPNTDLLVLMDIAFAQIKQTDFDQAIKTLSFIIDQNQPDILNVALLYRGLAYEKMGELEHANMDYVQSILSNQENVSEYTSTQGTERDEIDFLTEKISGNPQNPYYHYWRGTLYQRLMQYEQALEDYNSAITLVPDFYVAREARSHVLMVLKNFQAVLNDLEVIFQMDYFYTPCNIQNRGVSYANLDEKEKAKEDFSEVISLVTQEIEENPQNASAYYVRYIAYIGMNILSSSTQFYNPFRPAPYYALLDMLKVQKLNPKLAQQTGITDIKSIFSVVFFVIQPYLFWTSFTISVVSCGKIINKFLVSKKRKH